MESRVAILIEHLPTQRAVILRLYAANQTFRQVCDDLRAAQSAATARQPEEGHKSQRRREEYADLVRELKREAERFIASAALQS
jgi:hypothetical protein